MYMYLREKEKYFKIIFFVLDIFGNKIYDILVGYKILFLFV